LTTTDSQITFSDIVNSAATQTRGLALNVGTSEVEFNGIVGGATNGGLGAIAVTGNLDLNAAIASATSLSVSGTSDLGANISTSGTQTYTGAVTVSGGNRTLTGSTINNVSTLNGGGFNLTITGNADINGDITGVTYLSVSGASNLGADITTTDTQIWTAPITLVGNTKLTSLEGAIELIGRVNASSLKSSSLTLDAKTTVIISGEIGLQSRIGDLVVVADNIYINNDIHTAVTQTYTINRNINGGYAGSVYIGDVDQSTRSTLFNEKVNATWIDTDGYTSQKADIKEVKNASESRVVRVLTSEDPNITFNGPVNDTIENTHSLVVLAITNIRDPRDSQVPIVHFASSVGLQRQLYSLTARSLYAASSSLKPVISGMVIIGGDVKTFANQTYGAAKIELTSSGTTTLYSQSGRVKMETNSYAMIGNLKLDYSAANRPEISSAPDRKSVV
jgi:hypothetical protein